MVIKIRTFSCFYLVKLIENDMVFTVFVGSSGSGQVSVCLKLITLGNAEEIRLDEIGKTT